MSLRDRRIKAFAICLGIFLVIMIMATILGVFGTVLNYIVPENGNEFDRKFAENITSVDIDLKTTSLKIIEGDEFKVEGTNASEKVKIDVVGGVLKISEIGNNFWKNKFKNSIILYIPKGINLEELDIEIGAGTIYIDGIASRYFELDQGAGNVDIESCEFKKAHIEGGAGRIDIRDSSLNDLNFSSGVGSTSIDGWITGDTELDCGVGSLVLDIHGSREDYRLDIDRGLGSIKVDGTEDYSSGNGKNYLKVDGGVGSIHINFKDQ